ncbi:MAG: hypothetical protein CMN56_13870 [Sneathiella sp.]|uniref:hypothetical protein n=1 Tax=Sneathiella sp. TaxID=1964365 RepID=UPI000C5B42AC|nr:hypothetical protein [Sneathiella sp.]MAZ04215.1 hypothetical protein [Sneathiella sp.]
MKIIAVMLTCLFTLGACEWFASKPAEADTVNIQPLPLNKQKLDMTIGSRYILNADDGTQNKMRMFMEKKFLEDHAIKFAWARQIGETINFFNYETVDGVDYRDTGEIFLEYSYSF